MVQLQALATPAVFAAMARTQDAKYPFHCRIVDGVLSVTFDGIRMRIDAASGAPLGLEIVKSAPPLPPSARADVGDPSAADDSAEACHEPAPPPASRPAAPADAAALESTTELSLTVRHGEFQARRKRLEP
jgi:hypothetical protein